MKDIPVISSQIIPPFLKLIPLFLKTTENRFPIMDTNCLDEKAPSYLLICERISKTSCRIEWVGGATSMNARKSVMARG